MSTNQFAVADWLRAENNQGYGGAAIPLPRDADVETLLRSWLAMDGTSRQISASRIQDEQRFTLLAYSERMATQGVRRRDRETLLLGLLALGIDGWRDDWRDNAALISLHYDAAHRIEIDAPALFEEAASLLPPRPANALRLFLRRSRTDKSIESMGYIIGADANGFRYKRTW